jgi:hypothetical protein
MGKRIAYTLSAAFLALVVVGCAAAPMDFEAPREEKAGEAPAAMPTQVAEAPAEDVKRETGGRAGDSQGVERLIIRNANLSIVVRNTESAVEEIDALAAELGGYVIESSISEYREGKQARLRLRVPAEELDSALERIREISMEVRRESISGQDVTDEYVDLQSRLRHLEATEERLLTFMEEAEDTEAALEVYDRLQNIQAQIEQTRGRMQYLEQSAAMATITLDVTPSELAQPIEVGGWHPQGTLRDAFESLIRVFQFLVDALIVIVVLVLPVLIIIALPVVGLFLLIRWIVRRRRRAKQAKEEG